MIERSYSFENITVDAQKSVLLVDGKAVECEPKLFELLVFFCQNPEIALSRDALIEQVWQGRVVSDAAVNRAVSQLRKLIEPDATSPRYIVTVSKVGYRFCGNLQSIQAPSNQAIQSLPLKPLLGLAIMLVVLLSVLFFWQRPSEPLLLTHQHMVSHDLNPTFNPYFDKQQRTLYVLHKADGQGNNQVYQLAINGELTAITNDDFYYTDVIAEHGVMYAARLNNLVARQCELVSINPVNNETTVISDCGQSVILNLAMDSHQRLIYPYRDSASSPYNLFAIAPNTQRKEQLTNALAQGNNLGHRVFATNQHQLAYIDYQSGATDMLIIKNLSTGEITQQSALLDDVLAITWWQDSIVVSAKTGIYQYQPANNQLIQLDYSGQYGRLTADDKALFSERHTLISNLYQISNKRQALTQRQGHIVLFQPSHQSGQLVYLQQHNNQLHIMLQNQTRIATEIPFTQPIKYITNFAWAKDDSQFAAVINDDVYVYHLASNTWQQVQHSFAAVHFVEFDHAGRLYISAEYQKKWNIWRFDTSKAQPIQITEQGGYSLQISNDQLFYTKFNQDGLFSKVLGSQRSKPSETQLIADFPLLNWRHWQVAGQHILFKQHNQYQLLDTHSSQIRLLDKLDALTDAQCRFIDIKKPFICNQVDSQSTQVWRLAVAQ